MDNWYEYLERKYCNLSLATTPKLYFEAALAEIDHHFNQGDITQREWPKLYEIICEWLA